MKLAFQEWKGKVKHIGADKSAPLYEAARRGHFRALKLLLEAGVAVDLRNGEKETPLRSAARWGKWPSCSLLIEYGARARAESRNGKKPADLAKSFGCKKTFSVLENAFTAGQLNPRDLSLQTAFYAAAHEKTDLTASLIEKLLISRNARGIRDLWMGHNLLLLAWRNGLHPSYNEAGVNGELHCFFFKAFYHAIVGKCHSKEERDVAERIMSAAQRCEILSDGERAATAEDIRVVEQAVERITPIINDLCHRIIRIEERQGQIEADLYQTRK